MEFSNWVLKTIYVRRTFLGSSGGASFNPEYMRNL